MAESADQTETATPVKAKVPAKKPATRKHRGQTCPVVKVTKNTRTGAIYDLIEYTRSVTNRKTGEVKQIVVGKKLRRPGTGMAELPREVEVQE